MSNSLNVVRSAYYNWRKTPHTVNDEIDVALMILVQEEFKKGRSVYGEMRVWKTLRKKGINTSRRRVRRLMAEASLICITRKPYKATADSKHDSRLLKISSNGALILKNQTAFIQVILPTSKRMKVCYICQL